MYRIMKELSIKQKAKAYDEALERARKLHKDAIYMDDNVHIKQYESIFPELKENDEKIKKALIDIVYDTIGDSFWVDYGVHKEEAVAWLEKQESVGEIVERCKTSWYNEGKIQGQIEGLSDEEKYQQGWHDALEKQGEQSNSSPIWKYKKDSNPLIQDSLILNKYGCVAKSPSGAIVSDVWVLDYDALAKLPKEKLESKFKVGDWVVYQNQTFQVTKSSGNNLILQGRKYQTYFIEELCKPWNISDAKDGDVLVDEQYNIGIYKEIEGICWHSYIYLGCDNFLYGFRVGGSHIQNNTKPATKEQREQLKKAISDAGYTFDFEKKELKKIEQKTAWGEEDEKRLKRAIHIFEDNLENFENTGINDEIDESLISWLKTLKDRVQPKQEWSEEDWNYIADLISYFDGSSLQHDTPDVISWLKSLKPQNTWKPSNEQMKALHHLNLTGNISYAGQGQTLIELYNDLKKLREE